jgi:hypothetical protein
MFASACRPASVIHTQATAVFRPLDYALGLRGREPGVDQLDE